MCLCKIHGITETVHRYTTILTYTFANFCCWCWCWCWCWWCCGWVCNATCSPQFALCPWLSSSSCLVGTRPGALYKTTAMISGTASRGYQKCSVFCLRESDTVATEKISRTMRKSDMSRRIAMACVRPKGCEFCLYCAPSVKIRYYWVCTLDGK